MPCDITGVSGAARLCDRYAVIHVQCAGAVGAVVAVGAVCVVAVAVGVGVAVVAAVD